MDIEPIHNLNPEPENVCMVCLNPLSPNAFFCAKCGNQLFKTEQPPADFKAELYPVLSFYFITLLIIIVYKFTELFDESIAASFFLNFILAVITVGFAAYNFKYIKGLYAFTNLHFKPLFFLIAGLIVGAVAVNFVANFLNANIYEEVYYYTLSYEDSSFPVLFTVFSICFIPAVFEELAFRGFLFNHIAKLSGNKTAIIVTSFLFGLMHLSFISMLWLIPLGWVFAVFRSKYNTLWYGIIGHFIYNGAILIIEYYELGYFDDLF